MFLITLIDHTENIRVIYAEIVKIWSKEKRCKTDFKPSRPWDHHDGFRSVFESWTLDVYFSTKGWKPSGIQYSNLSGINEDIASVSSLKTDKFCTSKTAFYLCMFFEIVCYPEKVFEIVFYLKIFYFLDV